MMRRHCKQIIGLLQTESQCTLVQLELFYQNVRKFLTVPTIFSPQKLQQHQSLFMRKVSCPGNMNLKLEKRKLVIGKFLCRNLRVNNEHKLPRNQIVCYKKMAETPYTHFACQNLMQGLFTKFRTEFFFPGNYIAQPSGAKA